MGRRKTEPNPAEIRRTVARHFRHLMGPETGLNMVQFTAQLHERDMVELLVGFALDATLPPPLRRDSALDVIRLARGPVAPWIHDRATIDPDGIAPSGRPVADELAEIKKATALYQALDDLVRRGVPPEQWPEDVREAAGDLLDQIERQGGEDGGAE
ncbi:MAG: hypothetical protein KGL52_04735 [Rhodospirillales bacterium]|nr:hypothetical protein [Rhodospirillales bacterium]